jgi:hypothetical protein
MIYDRTYHPAVVVDLPGGVRAGGGAGCLGPRLLGVHLVEAGVRDAVLLVVQPSVFPHPLLRPVQSHSSLLYVRTRVCWPFLCLCRQFMIFEGCLDSNPESLR